MVPNSSRASIDSLRATLQKVEQDSGLAPDDPSLLELKRIVLDRIAEVELAKAENGGLPGDDINAPEPGSAVDPALERAVDQANVSPLLAQTTADLPSAADGLPNSPKRLDSHSGSILRDRS